MASKKNTNQGSVRIINEDLAHDIAAIGDFIRLTSDSVLPDSIQKSVDNMRKDLIKWSENLMKIYKVPIIDRHRTLNIAAYDYSNECTVIEWWPNGIINIKNRSRYSSTTLLGHEYNISIAPDNKITDIDPKLQNKIVNNYKYIIAKYGSYRWNNIHSQFMTDNGYECSQQFMLNDYLSERLMNQTSTSDFKTLVDLRKDIKSLKKMLKDMDKHYDRAHELKQFITTTFLNSPANYRDQLQSFLTKFITDLREESIRMAADPDRDVSYGDTDEEHQIYLLNDMLSDFNNDLNQLFNATVTQDDDDCFEETFGDYLMYNAYDLIGFPDIIPLVKQPADDRTYYYDYCSTKQVEIANLLNAAYPEIFYMKIKDYLLKNNNQDIDFDDMDTYEFQTACEIICKEIINVIASYGTLCAEILEPISKGKKSRRTFAVIVPNSKTISQLANGLATCECYLNNKLKDYPLTSLFNSCLTETKPILYTDIWIDPSQIQPIDNPYGFLWTGNLLPDTGVRILNASLPYILNDQEIPLELIQNEFDHLVDTIIKSVHIPGNEEYDALKERMNQIPDKISAGLDKLENSLLISDSEDFIQWCIKKKLVSSSKGKARIKELTKTTETKEVPA